MFYLSLRIFIGLLLIWVGAYLLIIIIRSYKLNRNIIQQKYLFDFETIDGNFIESEIGIKHIDNDEYVTTKYFPYIKYSYTYDGIEYFNDKFSYPFEPRYNNNITVKRIIDCLRSGPFKIWIKKSDPYISYIHVSKDDLNRKIFVKNEKNLTGYRLISFIPMLIIFTGFFVIFYESFHENDKFDH